MSDFWRSFWDGAAKAVWLSMALAAGYALYWIARAARALALALGA